MKRSTGWKIWLVGAVLDVLGLFVFDTEWLKVLGLNIMFFGLGIVWSGIVKTQREMKQEARR